MIQQLCDRLNEGNVVDFQEVPIITIGVLFKNFLRNMPDSLLPLAMYNGKQSYFMILLVGFDVINGRFHLNYPH